MTKTLDFGYLYNVLHYKILEGGSKRVWRQGQNLSQVGVAVLGGLPVKALTFTAYPGERVS